MPSARALSVLAVCAGAIFGEALFRMWPVRRGEAASGPATPAAASTTTFRSTATSAFASAAGGGSLSTAYACDALRARGRGEYPLPHLVSLLHQLAVQPAAAVGDGAGAEPSFTPLHHQVNASCPRFVVATQDSGKGITRRLINWAMGAAVSAQWGLTLVHESFAGGVAEASAPPGGGGWDGVLGLGDGELTEADVERLYPQLTKQDLPGWGGHRYSEKVFEVSDWVGILSSQRVSLAPSSPSCTRLYKVPPGGWAHDVSYHTKLLMSFKFERERQRRRGLAGGGGDPKPLWSADEIVIAVHVRRGAMPPLPLQEDLFWDFQGWATGKNGQNGGTAQKEWYPTHETVAARIIRETVVPALRDAGVTAPLVVAVFSDWTGEGGGQQQAFPTLAALPKVLGGDVRTVFRLDDAEADAWTALYHLTQADFLIGSESLFSFWAGVLSSRPLVLSQEDSDRWRQCSEGSACCLRSGNCVFAAEMRVRETARRLSAMQRCGLLR